MHHKYTLENRCKKSFRFWILSLLFLSIAFLTLVGCGSQPEATSQLTENSEQLVSSPYYSEYEFNIDATNISGYILADQYCAILKTSYSDEYLTALERFQNDPLQTVVSDESGKPLYPDYEICSYTYAGEPASTIDLNAISPSSLPPLIALAGDENMAVLCTRIDSEDGSILGAITVFDDKGEMQSQIKTIALDRSITSYTGFCEAGNGNFYILGEDVDYKPYLSVVSSSGKLLSTYPMEDLSPNMLIPSSNGIYVITKSYDKSNSCTTTATPFVDGKLSMNEGITLPAFFNDCSDIFMRGDSIYGSDSNSLQAFSIKDKTLKPILEWNNYNLSFIPYKISVTTSGAIVAIGTEFDADTCKASVLTPSLTNPNGNKTQIIVAGYEIASDETLLMAVKDFNQSHSDSRIVLRDYAEDYAFDSGDYRKDIAELNQKMRLEFFNGEAPDIWIDTESDKLGLAAFATDAYLIDLYPYIQKDPDIHLDHYFKNVLFGYDTNGKLYMFPSGFFTRCFYGNPSVIGTDSSWTFSDFYALSDKLGSEKKILTDIPKTDLLEWILETSMSSYVDLDSNRVSFNSDSFIDLLNWANTYGTNSETYTTSPNDVVNSKTAIDLTWIDSPESFYSNYINLKFMPTYLGYPNSNADGLSFFPEYVCGITTSCKDPELAWDFVRLFLLDDVQDSLSVGFIPVSKDAAAKQIQSAVSRLRDDGLDTDDVDNTFWDSYYDVLEKVNTPKGANYEVTCIVLEESAAFFAGQKTAEEVAELIQNRVQVYVDEQMK